MTGILHRILAPRPARPASRPGKPGAAALLLTLIFSLSGCTTVAVVGATAGAAVAVTGAAVKGTGAAVGAVIPDGEDEEKEDD